MAEDKKFKFVDGMFVNRISGEPIPDDEPVIIFRARDVHALAILWVYYDLCNDSHHRKAIKNRIDEFTDFKNLAKERMKEPGITQDMALNTEI